MSEQILSALPPVDQSPEGQEVAGHLSLRQYLSESLHKDESLQDLDGHLRPAFEIAGHIVVFRNRQETPEFAERTVAVVAPEASEPLGLDKRSISTDEVTQRTDQIKKYVDTSSKDISQTDLCVVTNTPEGLIGAALTLTDTPDPRLIKIKADMESRMYGPEALAVIDAVLAATGFDDEGKPLGYIDTDGFALVLASLTGDTAAQDLIAPRLDGLYRDHALRKTQKATGLREHADEYWSDIEAFKPSEIALVHSTSYPLERDSNGDIVLYPSSAKRDDRMPRSTIHFTVNAQVTSHISGIWADTNKLIVTNMAKMIEADGLPENMADADTYYALNPGEKLRLPDAVVVEGGPIDELIHTENGQVIYKQTETYSAEEMRTIKQLADMVGIQENMPPQQLLREVALRQAMRSQGADWAVTVNAHYVQDENFQKRYRKLGSELGVYASIHANTDDLSLEHAGAQIVTGTENVNAYLHRPSASLAARRQQVASGYMPAHQPDPVDPYQGFLSGF